MVPRQRRAVRRLSARRSEGLCRRVCGPERRRRPPRKPQRLGVRAVGSRVYDRPGAERRRRDDVVIRPFIRPRGRLAMDAQSDLVRQPPLVRDAELLRAETVQREPWLAYFADRGQWFYQKRAAESFCQRFGR